MKNLLSSVLLLSVFLFGITSPCHGQGQGNYLAMTLDQAYALALEHHEGIIIAKKEIIKSKLLPTKANAMMMPRLNLYGEYLRYDDPIDFQIELGGVMLPPITTRPEEQSRVNAEVVQPIYQGAWLPRKKQAGHAVAKSEEDYGWTAQNILFQVATAYYEIIKAQNYISITEEFLQRSQEENRIAKVKFGEGAVTEDVVLNTELKISAGRTRLLSEKNDLRLARKAFSLLVGDIPEGFEVQEPNEPRLKSENVEELMTMARQERMDYRSAQSTIEVARYDMSANKARYQPSLEGSWDYYVVHDPPYDQAENYWIAALRLKVPLFDGGFRSCDLKESEQSLQQAQLNAARLEKQLKKDIEQALTTIQTNRSILESLDKQLELAKKNYEIVLAKFKHGATDAVSLNQALDTLDKVNRDRITKKYDQQLALLEQERAAGIFLSAIIADH